MIWLREKISGSFCANRFWLLELVGRGGLVGIAARDRGLGLDLGARELRIRGREIRLAIAQLLLRLARIELRDHIALLDEHTVGSEPRDLHRAERAGRARCRDLRRLDRAQIALGGDPAHELLLLRDVARGLIAGGPGAQEVPARDGDAAEDHERDQRFHHGLHFATPGSIRDTRSPGASPDLTSIAVVERLPSTSFTFSKPPPCLR